MAYTITEIAKLAGVSTATVSRVFSGNSYVNDETKKRVLELANSMGYMPRTMQRSAACTHVRRMGMVIPSIRNPYYVDVTKSVEAHLAPYGIVPLMCSTEENPERELAYLNVLKESGVVGIILVPTINISEQSVRLLSELDSSGVPVVLLDRDIRSEKMDGVFLDNYSGAYQSVKTFIACGHKNIAFLGSNRASSADVDRLRGYLGAMTDGGIPHNPEYIAHGDFSFDLSYDSARALLLAHPEITAIFASSRQICAGCLFALASLGLSVPEDMAIICSGEPDINTDATSYVSYPTNDIGRECAKILYGKMTGNPKKQVSRRRTYIDMKMVLRGTEKFPNKDTEEK